MIKWLIVLILKTVIYSWTSFMVYDALFVSPGIYVPEGATGYTLAFFALFLIPDYIFTCLFPWVGIKWDFPLGFGTREIS